MQCAAEFSIVALHGVVAYRHFLILAEGRRRLTRHGRSYLGVTGSTTNAG